MSRCGDNAGGPARDARADRPSALRESYETLTDLAEAIAGLAEERTEDLPYGEHADLMELEARLRAYAELLLAVDRDAFVQAELQQAAEHFAYVCGRIGGDS